MDTLMRIINTGVINSKMSETFLPLSDTIIIRITSNENFAKMDSQSQFMDILELRFDDISEQHPKEDSMLYGKMTQEHYNDIKRFIQKYQSVAKNLIIHCDAGQSRSPAVALGILDYLIEDHEHAKELVLKNGHWKPNAFVLSYFKRDYYNIKE